MAWNPQPKCTESTPAQPPRFGFRLFQSLFCRSLHCRPRDRSAGSSALCPEYGFCRRLCTSMHFSLEDFHTPPPIQPGSASSAASKGPPESLPPRFGKDGSPARSPPPCEEGAVLRPCPPAPAVQPAQATYQYPESFPRCSRRTPAPPQTEVPARSTAYFPSHRPHDTKRT